MSLKCLLLLALVVTLFEFLSVVSPRPWDRQYQNNNNTTAIHDHDVDDDYDVDDSD